MDVRQTAKRPRGALDYFGSILLIRRMSLGWITFFCARNRVVRGLCLPVLCARPVAPRLILPLEEARENRFLIDPLMLTLRNRTSPSNCCSGLEPAPQSATGWHIGATIRADMGVGRVTRDQAGDAAATLTRVSRLRQRAASMVPSSLLLSSLS